MLPVIVLIVAAVLAAGVVLPARAAVYVRRLTTPTVKATLEAVRLYPVAHMNDFCEPAGWPKTYWPARVMTVRCEFA